MIIYAQQEIEPLLDSDKLTVFLAGPTPRSGLGEVESWRPLVATALSLYANVLVPEDESGIFNEKIDDQIDWEWEGLDLCDVALFWVPRDLETLPGFTTNIEFGYMVRSGRMIYGRPDGAPGTHYMDRLAERHGVEVFNDLDLLTVEAIHRLWKVI